MKNRLRITSDLQYEPKVQTYIKNNSGVVNGSAIDHPPSPNRGVRYAIAQGPSVVPAIPNADIIAYAIQFNLNTVEVAASLAHQYNAQLITFPELHMSGYEFGDTQGGNNQIPIAIAHGCADYLGAGNYWEQGGPISLIANRYNVALVVPMPYHGSDPAGNAPAYYDVAVVFGPDGSVLGIQFKTHLWGIDEKRWFSIAQFPPTNVPVIQGPGMPHFADSPYAPFYINDFPVGVGICYDAEFPEVARCQALNGSLLTVFPTAAPDSILPGQTTPYPDIAEHYIPANALQNQNFCSYSNRAGIEYQVQSAAINPSTGQWTAEAIGGLTYTGNSVLCSPYGANLVAPVANEHTLLIADCVHCDFPLTQPNDTNYLINRRPELAGYLTNRTVSFPFGKNYTYPPNPVQHQDPIQPQRNENSCGI